MIKIGISGACGKMGRRIGALLVKSADAKIALALERSGAPEMGKDLGPFLGCGEIGATIVSDLEKNCADIDCLIEFTSPEATLEHLKLCEKKGVAMVIGTTGLDEKCEEKIKISAKKIPIVFSPNMAVGVNLLFNLVLEASRVLGPDFEIKLDETHHVHKKDSPSGTAKMIARIIAGATGKTPPVEAFRKGEVIGNHGIVFDGEYETLEIRHNAKSRDVFAAGAIRAARFVVGKKPGLYSMADVLGVSNAN